MTYRKKKYNAANLHVLTLYRENAGLTLDQMAAYFGLTGGHRSKSASGWESGISRPIASRREKFILYLKDKLKLKSVGDFKVVWCILESEWKWSPLSEEEWKKNFPRQAIPIDDEDVFREVTGKLKQLLTVVQHSPLIQAEIEDPEAVTPIINQLRGHLLQDDRLIKRLNGHTYYINKLAIHPDKDLLASCSGDKNVLLWNVLEGQIVKRLRHEKWVGCVRLSKKYLASSTGKGTLRVWDIDTLNLIGKTSICDGACRTIVFSHDERQLISGDEDGNIQVFNLPDLTQRHMLTGHSAEVRTISLHHDLDSKMTCLASGDADGIVNHWDLSSGTFEQIYWCPNHFIRCVAYAEDGKDIAITTTKGDLIIWNTESRTIRWERQAHLGHAVGVAFSRDKSLVATTGQDYVIKIWDCKSGDLLSTLRGHRDTPTCIVFSNDSKRLATAGRDKSICIWNADGLR